MVYDDFIMKFIVFIILTVLVIFTLNSIDKYINNAKFYYLMSIGFTSQLVRIGYDDKYQLKFIKNEIILTETDIKNTTLSELKEKYN